MKKVLVDNLHLNLSPYNFIIKDYFFSSIPIMFKLFG